MGGVLEQVLIVLTNVPDRTVAEQLARALIANRAAACVNILAGCSSVYRWNGAVEQACEIPLLIKTTQAAYPRVEQTIRELHPYELPEIVAVPVVAGLPAYLDWVARETNLTPP